MMYTRANGEDEEIISQALTQKPKAGVIQLGQGTLWDGGKVRQRC